MKNSWVKAAAAIAEGRTDDEAAESAGVSSRTIRAWKADQPEFVARVNDIRGQMFETSAGMLSALTVKAVEFLEAALEEGGSVALRAAQTIIRSAADYREIADFEGRLLELEVAVGIRRETHA